MTGISTKFSENGYVIVTADNQEALLKVKQIIFEKCKEVFNYEGEDADWFFDNFHSLDISAEELNIKRLEIIQYCAHSTKVNKLIFDAFQQPIMELLGRDIMVQKVTNLVIQPPEDLNTSEPHRDTPTDSFYSIVVWVPLTDSYGTKTLNILELEQSKKLFKLIQSNPDNWTDVASTVLEKGIPAEVPFGSGIILWPNLYHGSKVNTETETRWTLNIRYINAFAPKGHKDPFGYFELLCVSPLTQLALEAEKAELLK
jgi:sporadic carbohydrate cluster 2OG-Fe(II) oxygenase